MGRCCPGWRGVTPSALKLLRKHASRTILPSSKTRTCIRPPRMKRRMTMTAMRRLLYALRRHRQAHELRRCQKNRRRWVFLPHSRRNGVGLLVPSEQTYTGLLISGISIPVGPCVDLRLRNLTGMTRPIHRPKSSANRRRARSSSRNPYFRSDYPSTSSGLI